MLIGLGGTPEERLPVTFPARRVTQPTTLEVCPMKRIVETVTIPYDALQHETEKAWLVNVEGIAIWVPKSVVLSIDENAQTFEVARWWAEDRNLA